MPRKTFGTTLKWNAQTVARLTAINGIELSRNMIDITNHQSPDEYKEVLPGLIDPNEVTIEGLFDETDTAGQHAMLTDFNAGTLREAIITFPATSGASWTFNGYITRIKIGDAPVEGYIPFSASIKPTGKPVFAISAVTGMSVIAFDNSVLVMPTFAIGTYEYVVTIANGESATIITPTDSTAGEVITITANGVSQVVTSGAAATEIALDSTKMTDIVVTISAANKAPKVYTIRINRP